MLGDLTNLPLIQNAHGGILIDQKPHRRDAVWDCHNFGGDGVVWVVDE